MGKVKQTGLLFIFCKQRILAATPLSIPTLTAVAGLIVANAFRVRVG